MSPGEKSRTMNIPKFWMMKYKIFFKKQMQNLKGGGASETESMGLSLNTQSYTNTKCIRYVNKL